VLGVLVVCCAGGAWAVWSVGPDSSPGAGPTATVQRGPLVVSVTEGGELEAERRKVISNELRWPVIIREVVPEGTIVEKGQTIVQFECKELLDSIAQEELQVTSAQNNYTQAVQSLELKKEEMANKVLKAKRELEEARENLKRYEEHDYPIEFRTKDSAVQIADRELKLAEERLAFKLDVNKRPELEGTYSDNDIEAERLKVEQLRNSLEKAKLELAKLQKYEHGRQMQKLKDAVGDAELGLKRARLEAKNQILIAEADMQAKKRTYEMRKKKLDELREDERKLTVKAEKAGLVVYDTARRRWETPIRVSVGEKINPRQQLMVIPDMNTLQIKTKVYEAIIDQVKVGIPAYIRLDAKPDVTFSGKVKKVAPLPDSQNRWLNPGVKVFNVIVEFDKHVAGLKPGMTARVELVLAELADVLSVPVAAVFTEQEKTFCYRLNGGEPEQVIVEVGRMNDRRVEIASGLAEGDRVLLAPPSTAPVGGEKPAEGLPVATPTGKVEGARR